MKRIIVYTFYDSIAAMKDSLFTIFIDMLGR